MAIGSPPITWDNIPANCGCALVHLCLTLRGMQAWWYVCMYEIFISDHAHLKGTSPYYVSNTSIIKRFQSMALSKKIIALIEITSAHYLFQLPTPRSRCWCQPIPLARPTIAGWTPGANDAESSRPGHSLRIPPSLCCGWGTRGPLLCCPSHVLCNGICP